MPNGSHALSMTGTRAVRARPARRVINSGKSNPLLRGLLHVFLISYLGVLGVIWPSAASNLLLLFGVTISVMVIRDKYVYALALRCRLLLILFALAALSTLWSTDPQFTFRQSIQLLFAMLLGILISGKLGIVDSGKIFIRSMSAICVLSVIWATAYPLQGIHQATDATQAAHAGLWRGVLGHKVGLGIFSGACLGLILFVGRRVFSNPISYLVAISSSATCLYQSGSATGIMALISILGLGFSAKIVATSSVEMRKSSSRLLVICVALLLYLMYSGALNHLASMLGKSGDLSGRTDYWPHVLAVVNSGSYLIGYGFVAGHHALSYQLELLSGIALKEAHNGVLDQIVAFGYLGAAVVIYIHLAIFAKAVGAVLRAKPSAAAVFVFPFVVIATLFVISYAESSMMTRVGMWSIILALAYGNLMQIDDYNSSR